MGLFSDFANSAAGDLTIGAFEGLNQAAQKDVVVNATASNDALRKENEAFALTETAFKNRKEIANILAANPGAFGLSSQEGLGIDQVADRFANFMFLQQRSMFENKDMDKVKLNVAKFMASNPGQGFDIYDPYIKGEDRFNQEKESHQARISEISKMPKADKLLMNIKEAEAEVATPESITNELTKVSALTAKGFGILNTYPTSEAGMKNLHFVQVNLITSNAKKQFPNDAVARAEFIDQRLYDNNIDPTDGIMYSNNLNFRIMAKAIDTMGGANANKITELTNAIAAAPDAETRKQLNDQMNTIVLDSHKIMNTYSSQAGSLMAGENRDQVFPTANTDSIGLPQVMENYVPSIDNLGNVVIELANGNTQNIPLELLIDSPDSVKLLPQVTQNYVNQIKENFFVDGEMIEPKREMFEEGRAGDKAFKDFLGVYNIFFPDNSDDIFNEVETLEPTPKRELKDGDISQIKKDKTEDGNTVKVEELAPADTIVPKRKPDAPVKAEEPKEKTLQDKIQEDFGKPNVGISAGDATNKEDVKTDTQIQTEDVFEGSGVDPMYQSASMKEKVGEGSIPFLKLTKNNNMNNTYNYLRGTLNEKASAAILGNIYAENDTFAFSREEEGDINKLKDKERGYGIFQFTNYKDKASGEIVGHRKEYFNYLENTGREDSIESQIQYVLDNIYKGIGFNIGEKNRERLKDSFKNDSIKDITNKFMRIFENPAVKNIDKRSNFALEAFEHYTTIQEKS